LIRALPAGAALRIAGSSGHAPRPPERDYPALLRRLAHGQDVAFLGPVLGPDLPGLYDEPRSWPSRPSTGPGFGRHVPVSALLGLAALEDMASGTPVIASRIGGWPRLSWTARRGSWSRRATPRRSPSASHAWFRTTA
jgi:glycosyltransferase involved in cell wall biosynthesis